MVKAKKIIYAKKFEGQPTLKNFRIEEEELPAIKDDEILCQAEYLSIDPYMRPYMMNFAENTVMIGTQVAKILESKNAKYPVGAYVLGNFGWRTHTVVKPVEGLKGAAVLQSIAAVSVIPDIGKLPRSLAIGYLGMPGQTAYFGFLDICTPKAGETVVVTAAAGAVGSLVGQIAKIKGCTVIGFAGSDDKCDWLKKELGFDYAYNYKTVDLSKCFQEAAPKGVDCYFDNVGGELSSQIISKMNHGGRISVCGSISAYNATTQEKASILQRYFVGNELKMEGFMVYRWQERYPEAISAISKWIQDGKVKYRETITKGFENMPQAFIELLNGKNTGKAIIQV